MFKKNLNRHNQEQIETLIQQVSQLTESISTITQTKNFRPVTTKLKRRNVSSMLISGYTLKNADEFPYTEAYNQVSTAIADLISYHRTHHTCINSDYQLSLNKQKIISSLLFYEYLNNEMFNYAYHELYKIVNDDDEGESRYLSYDELALILSLLTSFKYAIKNFMPNIEFF